VVVVAVVAAAVSRTIAENTQNYRKTSTTLMISPYLM
jgi:hypothetical protein